MTCFIIQIAAFGVVIASIAFNYDVLKLEFGSFLACGLAIWLSLVTLQAFKQTEWLVYKQQKDYVTISSSLLSTTICHWQPMVTLFQSYTKSVFFGEYFNQPSPLYLPIKLIEFISEVNPSRNVLDGYNIPKVSSTYFCHQHWFSRFRFELRLLDYVNKSELMGVSIIYHQWKHQVLI